MTTEKGKESSCVYRAQSPGLHGMDGGGRERPGRRPTARAPHSRPRQGPTLSGQANGPHTADPTRGRPRAGGERMARVMGRHRETSDGHRLSKSASLNKCKAWLSGLSAEWKGGARCSTRGAPGPVPSRRGRGTSPATLPVWSPMHTGKVQAGPAQPHLRPATWKGALCNPLWPVGQVCPSWGRWDPWGDPRSGGQGA